MTTTERLPIDGHVVALNETNHYKIKPEHQPHIQAIRGVYLYDANSHTHCCELTPSYYLIYLYDEVILTPEADESLSDEAKEAIYEEYEYCDGEDIYVHVHNLDTYVAAHPERHHHHGGTEISYDDSDYDDQIEGLREYFNGNHVL